jgi:hypothetical protein
VKKFRAAFGRRIQSFSKISTSSRKTARPSVQISVVPRVCAKKITAFRPGLRTNWKLDPTVLISSKNGSEPDYRLMENLL